MWHGICVGALQGGSVCAAENSLYVVRATQCPSLQDALRFTAAVPSILVIFFLSCRQNLCHSRRPITLLAKVLFSLLPAAGV